MTKSKWLAAGLACLAVFAFATPKGTVARSTALKYPAHAEQDGVAMGAVRLTSEEARKDFVSDVNHCCLVVKVALYPQKGQNLEVSLNDFLADDRHRQRGQSCQRDSHIRNTAKEGGREQGYRGLSVRGSWIRIRRRL